MVIAWKQNPRTYIIKIYDRLVINKLQINLQKGRFAETQRGLHHRKLYELNLLEQTQNVRYHFLINLLTSLSYWSLDSIN